MENDLLQEGPFYRSFVNVYGYHALTVELVYFQLSLQSTYLD
jgi:hypothetical protein